jgi:hypothetical protein
MGNRLKKPKVKPFAGGISANLLQRMGKRIMYPQRVCARGSLCGTRRDAVPSVVGRHRGCADDETVGYTPVPVQSPLTPGPQSGPLGP